MSAKIITCPQINLKKTQWAIEPDQTCPTPAHLRPNKASLSSFSIDSSFVIFFALAALSTAMASLLLGAPPVASPSLYSRISFAQSQTFGSSISSGQTSLPICQTTASVLPLVYCGRGDKKTAKGKRFNHSFGNARPRNKNNGRGPPRVPVPGAAPKKDPFEDTEVIKIDIDESLLPN